jgi:DNA topoisomerase-1
MQKALSRHALSPQDMGLVVADLNQTSITRVRKGRGFSYVTASGNTLSGKRRLHIEGLAIPPAWESVWISDCKKSHISAYGTDAAGRRQYIYNSKWRAACEAAKFIDLPLFARGLPKLRRRVNRDMSADIPNADLAIATIIRLLDRGGLRIGNWSSETNGAVSLTEEHISFENDQMHLHYNGKGGTEREVEIEDEHIVDAILRLMKVGDDEIFTFADTRIRPRDVNKYISETMGAQFSAKDFRTWGGSVAATRALIKYDASTIKDISEAAADYLGNTPTIARSSYIHPAIIDALSQNLQPKPSGPVRLRKYERLCHDLINDYSHPLIKVE